MTHTIQDCFTIADKRIDKVFVDYILIGLKCAPITLVDAEM